MFKELLPIAQETALTLTITANKKGEVTVIVIPRPVSKDSDPVLSRPMQLTATAEELDAEFASVIAGCTSSRQSLREQLDAYQEIVEASKKEVAGKSAAALKKATAKPASSGAVPLEDVENEEGDDCDDGCGDVSAVPAPTAKQEPEISLF